MSNTTATQTGVPSAYPPPADFAANANATSDLYDAAEADRLGFWAEQANRLSWQTPFEEVLDWSNAPFAQWFVGGKLNVAYNCVDLRLQSPPGIYMFRLRSKDQRRALFRKPIRS
jgi:acetyl-CoA synthetase